MSNTSNQIPAGNSGNNGIAPETMFNRTCGICEIKGITNSHVYGTMSEAVDHIANIHGTGRKEKYDLKNSVSRSGIQAQEIIRVTQKNNGNEVFQITTTLIHLSSLKNLERLGWSVIFLQPLIEGRGIAICVEKKN